MTLSTPKQPDGNGSHLEEDAASIKQAEQELMARIVSKSHSKKKLHLPLTHQSSSPQGKFHAWWQKVGIRTRASLLAVLLGTLPVVGVGAIAYTIANQSILEKLAEHETMRVQNLQLTVGQFMQARYLDIQVFANLEIFTDPQLRSTVTAQQKAAMLDKIMATQGGIYSSIAVFDLYGNPVAQTSQGEKLTNHLNRSYIQAAKAANGAVLSQPLISTTSGEFSVYSADVIKDKLTGQPVGYIRARIPIQALRTLWITADNDGSEFYLASKLGEIFLSPEIDHIVSRDSADQPVDPSTAANVEILELAEVFPSISGVVLGDRHEATKAQNVLTERQELVAFSPWTPIDNLPDLGWKAITSADLAVLQVAQRRLFFAIALGTMAAAGVATGLAVWATRRFTQPILQAADAVKKIGQGNLQTRLRVSGNDEIAQLGSNINQMAVQLKQFNVEQQHAAQQLKLLASATAIVGNLDTEENQVQLNIFIEQVRTFLKADRAIVYRLDGTQVLSQNESIAPGQLSIFEQIVPNLLLSQNEINSYTNSQLLVADDVTVVDLADGLKQQWQVLQVKSGLVVPIVNQNRLFGLLTVHHTQGLHIWTAPEIDFCSQLGRQLGILMTVQQFSMLAKEQKYLKESLQKRALELMLEVDPVSQGDLTVRAQVTADEIGTIADSYNAMIGNLRKIVTQVQTASQQVTNTVGHNELSIQELSQAAKQQNQEIAIVLEQLDQMLESIRAVSASADQVDSIVQQTTATVMSSDTAMDRTVAGILAIRETVAITAKKVKRLGESSQKISGVVNLINEFAAQTNLLALNASIEAARAGEEGRGFAVVADEVRSLAQKSAEATTEIENLVADIQSETNEVVEAMETGTEQVVMGTKLVDETRESLNSITQVTAEMKTLVDSITQATLAQSESSENVSQVMKELANIIQKTSTDVGKVSTSYQDLLEISNYLQESVRQFKVS